MTAPLPHDEYERLRALYRYQILDTLPEEAFDRLTRLAARVLNVPVALVNFIDEQRQWAKACYGLPGPMAAPREFSPCAWTILSPDVLVVPDARQDERFAHNPALAGPPGVHLYAGAPLVTPDGYTIGTLCVLDHQPHHFGEREVAILRELAALAADELELRHTQLELQREVQAKTQMMKSLRRSTAHAETLLAVGSLLELNLEPRDAACRVAELLTRAAEVDWGGLVTVRENRAEVSALGTAAQTEDVFARLAGQGERQGESPLWQALEEPAGLYLDDYGAHPGAEASALAAGVRSVAWVPLGGAGPLRYVLCAARFSSRPAWSVHDRALFSAASASASAAGRHEQARSLQVVHTDALTGLANRRVFERHLQEALAATPLSLAVIDLGGVGQLNDREGQERGDALLRTFADVLCTTLQGRERAYHLGSDEFALILPDPALQDSTPARLHMEQRLQQVAEVMRRRGFHRFSAQVGVSVSPDDAQAASWLVRVAQERLHAEQRGRSAQVTPAL